MIRFRTLGSLDLARSDGPELRAVLAQPKRLALLTYLAVARPRGFHRRDRLLAMFWPESGAERARAALSRAIYFLRRQLGDGIIVNRGDEEIAVNADRFWCDAAAFEDYLERGLSSEALECYRGDLLPGFFTSDANGFEEWLEIERSHLRERASQAAWGLAAAAEAKGNLPVAAQWARRGVELTPLGEPKVRRLLVLLDAVGDRAGAADAYNRFSAQMAAELELAPAPETRALIEEIRARKQAVNILTRLEHEGEERQTTVERGPASGPLAVTRSRVRRRWAIGAAAVVAVSTPAILLARGNRNHFDPHRVYVTRFANLTGNLAFDDIGRVSADRIIQSLSGSGLVEVAARDAFPDSNGGTVAARQARAVADGGRRRAGVVVSGEVHRDGGRVSVQAWITDVSNGRVMWAVPPITVVTDSIQRAIDEVSERATGAVAALNVPRFAVWFPTATSPPRFAAFQEFAHGVELQLRGGDRDAVPHLRRAVELDSTFTWAQLHLARAHLRLYEEPVVDSIARALNKARERLMPVQQHWLDWMLSLSAEDPLGGYRSIKAAADLAPDAFLFDVAEAATRLNRPSETLDVLERIGPDGLYNHEAEYWGLLTRSYHALGDRKRELAAAREARVRYPDRINVLSFALSALAAGGKTGEVRALLDTALAFPRAKVGVPGVIADMPGLGLWPGRLMITAAIEFRAHGFTAAADENFKRAIAWYSGQQPAHVPEATYRFELARALYLSRDWSAAEASFRALAAADTSNFVYRGFLGKIAARRGDSTTARRVLALFDSLRPTLVRPHATAGYWQSKISSLLGDEAEAMKSLSEASGPQGRSVIHLDFDFEGMRDSREFREFVRPKG